jgi:hypothetical protein
MEANCFICSIERGEFDRNAEGFDKHVRRCVWRRLLALVLCGSAVVVAYCGYLSVSHQIDVSRPPNPGTIMHEKIDLI